ncbi:MarR family winged helix-turn-helix transcriptional regulator [Actinomadura rudentiformis]|uniref:MarR family transcriptional regulator n=1 Tax=Actinomadura rudentiformis TaxID=359158 RepID=A0A6H9YHX9_9ACTN|nr:MarR family transcriptional regulator [Actinomadura rudentiformis]KAB2346081.1 MarR family transcriptional regulator [Actinomadura rudentiformis]
MSAAHEVPARLRGLPSRLLTQAAMHADRLTAEGLSRQGAHKWHYAVLASLQEFGPASQASLSRRTGIYRSDLVAVINELAERGLVERAPDPEDRRRNVITMTGEGRAHLRKLDVLIASLQDELLAPFSEAEREQLIQLLERLNDHHARERQPQVDDLRAST